MERVLYIADPVVTEDTLGQQHRGQKEVWVDPRAVITPTGWDYIRQHQLHLSRTEAEPAAAEPEEAEGSQLTEVQPAAAETQLVQEGRCDHPDHAYGCRTDEFGSGFAEPSSCSDCAIHQQQQQQGKANGGCQGCNRHKTVQELVAAGEAADIEALVQQITDQIMERLEG